MNFLFILIGFFLPFISSAQQQGKGLVFDKAGYRTNPYKINPVRISASRRIITPAMLSFL